MSGEEWILIRGTGSREAATVRHVWALSPDQVRMMVMRASRTWVSADSARVRFEMPGGIVEQETPPGTATRRTTETLAEPALTGFGLGVEAAAQLLERWVDSGERETLTPQEQIDAVRALASRRRGPTGCRECSGPGTFDTVANCTRYRHAEGCSEHHAPRGFEPTGNRG